MLVTWPFVMLLLDYWPLRRFETTAQSHRPEIFCPLILEKIPFFVLSGVSCVVTVLAQRAGTAVAPLQDIPMGARLINAVISYARYIAKLIWPTRLAPIYPYVLHWPHGDALIATLLLVVITGLAVWQWKRRPYLLAGWAWYLGTLVPVIGLVQVGNQSIADRYTYVPAIGLLVMLVWSVTEWIGNHQWRAIGARLVAVGGVTACALVTQTQLMYWQNTETLFQHAVAVTTNNHVAWSSLGFYFADRHETRQAERCFRTALSINPGSFFAWNKLANVLVEQGRYEEAMSACQMALSSNPQMAAAHRTLGLVLVKQGRVEEAIGQYEESLRIEPDDASAHYNLANAFTRIGRFEKAREHYQQSVRLDPSSADAHNNLAYMFVRENKLTEAASEFRAALALEPGSWHAHYGLGDALARQGKLKEAANEFLQVLKIEPKSASAQAQINRIAWILASAPDPQVRDGARALELAQRVCELTSYTNAAVLETLAVARAETGRFAEAIDAVEKARNLALGAGQKDVARKAEELLELFRAGQPYRQGPTPPPH
jgi:tetratricopeptide (TPR) repeat protein